MTYKLSNQHWQQSTDWKWIGR